MGDIERQIRDSIVGEACRVDRPLLARIVEILAATDVGRQPAEVIAAAVKDKFGTDRTAPADEVAYYAAWLANLLRVTRRGGG